MKNINITLKNIDWCPTLNIYAKLKWLYDQYDICFVFNLIDSLKQ